MAKKILLIEDDLPLLRMYQIAFNKSGVDVLHAVDGEEGLKIALEKKPDLILLDLVIPKKDGFEVLENIKTSLEIKHVPVICLSVLHQEEDIQKCKDLGADNFFIKTDVPPDEVVTKVLSKLS